ncbi:carboxypeptidase-like regulatory domain-containing protein [uncultured Formosa sp.]|uniref:carboxypeptidase-like regulatory domain-containing protein n=1 Tax=uncultured Formosa sp. TaxID=255435 RepID=UPI002617FD5C|nr:carboxypeptidase-like regulatory domain-containing protein [uncultured Formosa sp.]
MGKFLVLFFLIIWGSHVTAQIIKIEGVLRSETNVAIPNATVIIYKNEKIVAFVYSNEIGAYQIQFQFKNSESDTLKLVANGLGFEQQEKTIGLGKDTEFTVDFILKEKLEDLNEVVLESWQKIAVKTDTVTYKVSAFQDGSEQVLEDLLKNIPGIEVASDGNIKVNGKHIDKLLIEGDDLFDDKYKLLTKNLDANVINELEILNNFEDNPVLKKFQDSEKVALNLKIKAEKKNVWFGNVDVGLGVENHFNSSANVGLLKKRVKFFNLTNGNTIGTTANSQVKSSKTINASSANINKKTEKRNTKIVNVDNLSDTNFSNNEDVFNTSFLNSLSFVTSLSDYTKLRSHTYFTFDEIEKQNLNLTEYFISPESITFSEQNNIKIKDISFATELELKHFSKNETYYTYDFTFENNPTQTRNHVLFNTEQISQVQDDEKYNLFNHLNVTKKLSDQILWLTYGYLGINKTNQSLSVFPNVLSDVFNNDDNTQINQKSETPLTYYGLISELTAKHNASEYGVEFSATVDKDDVESAFRFDNAPIIDSLSNNTRYRNTKFEATLKYNYTISKLLKLSSSLRFSQNYLELNTAKQQFFFVNPKIRLHTKKTKIGNFGVSYNYKSDLPNSRYLTEDYILKNYRTFTKGTAEIQQINNHSFGFYYTFNNYKKQFLINSMVMHSFSDRGYGLNSQVTEQSNFSTYTVIDGGRFTNYNLSITKYLSPLSSTLKISTNHNWTNNPIIINTITSPTINYSANYRLQGTTYFNLPINFKFGFQYNYAKGEFDSQITTNHYYESNVDATLRFSDVWLCKFENTYYSINHNTYWFSNFNVSYTPENSRWSYRLSANNLLNVKAFQNVYVSEFQRNETRINTLPLYVLLNVKYRF